MKTSRFHISLRFGLLFLAGCCLLPLFAQQSLIEVHAGVDKPQIVFGDRIMYTLTIDRAEQVVIKTPGHGTNLGQFEIKDYYQHEPIHDNGRIVEQFDYTISVFDTGHFEIPPFPIGFLESDSSSRYQFISSQGIDVIVASRMNSAENDIRDIRPAFGLPGNYLLWTIIVLLILALGFAAWWIYRAHKKRQENQPEERREVLRPAHELALEALESLMQKGLLAEEKYKQFYTELAEIVRQYLERRFYIKAMEETSTEIVESLDECGAGETAIRQMQVILTDSDMVKFAKHIPGRHETNATIEQVRQFIENSKLQFAPVEREVVAVSGNGTPGGEA